MKNLYKHLIVWTVFITYELSFVSWSGAPMSTPFDYAMHYLINIILFYVNAAAFNYFFDKERHKYLYIAGVLIVEIIFYSVMQTIAMKFMLFVEIHAPFKVVYTKRAMGLQFFRAIYILGFSIGYWFSERAVKQKSKIIELDNLRLKEEKQSAELEIKLAKAKNAYLQSQLNPHLLFNTLNFIYNSVRKLSTSAASAILLLSDMMRYSLADADADGRVPLESEVDHIKNFITLNQLRFGDQLHIEFKTEGTFSSVDIIPLVLISFVENMYKHGDLMEEQNPARIYIGCDDGLLTMLCSNKKNKVKITEGWGIGIKNAQERLSSYYPGQFAFEVKETDTRYDLLLKVQLVPAVYAEMSF